MKRHWAMVAGLGWAAVMPLRAAEKPAQNSPAPGMKHEAMMCEKHCNIMELDQTIRNLKAQAASADKTTTKAHLLNDIKVYQEKLEQDKRELESMK